MNDRWQEISVFIRVAESGSFSAAARELGFSQPSVSRIVTGLEARLGVRLLLRTTRALALTEAGAVFLDRARQAQADLEEAEDAARGVDSLRGTIRLAVPIIYGTRAVIPALAAFLARHPDLRIEITMRDERQNLVTGGVDVAIRMGTLEDSRFGARRIASVGRLLVAAPAYLAAKGVPTTHRDLTHHDAILHDPSVTGKDVWHLIHNGADIAVTVRGRMQVDAAPGVLAAVVAGLGIAPVTHLMSEDERQSGALVQVLPDYDLAPTPIYAVFPSGPRPSAKVRALVEHLASTL